jgi:L-threonylcarbamoyladenylate synthase
VPPAIIRPANAAALAEAVARLRGQQVVGLPTETVYGLAGLASSGAAVARIFAVKGRPSFDPLIAHVERPTPWPGRSTVAWLASQGILAVDQLTAAAAATMERLAPAFWPGPLTVVMPRGPSIHELATSGLPSVAVRMPAHPVAQALLAALGEPVVAPSANRFGRISPTSAADVWAELGDRIDLILDGGACAVGVESTVVSLEPSGGLMLLRPGLVATAQLAPVVGSPVGVSAAVPSGGAVAGIGLPSPGLLASHYAPGKPLHLLERALATLASMAAPADPVTLSGSGAPLPLPQGASVGLLALRGTVAEVTDWARTLWKGRVVAVEVLSERGELEEAARNLFGALRRLDASAAQRLVADGALLGLEVGGARGDSPTGLELAIADRLRRAAHGVATPTQIGA